MIASTTGIIGEETSGKCSVDTVLVKVAARCNLACDYCYFFFSEDDSWKRQPRVISDEVVDSLATNLESLHSTQREPFAIVLHGGEPLLLGASKLEGIFSRLRKHLDGTIPISMQTNGVLLDKEILDLCSRFQVSVSVSIDGPRAVNDKHRLTANGRSTFKQTLKGIELLGDHADSAFLFAGTLSVIDLETEPEQLYEFLKGIGSPSVDFLYRDGNHDRLPEGKSSFGSTEYGDWLVRLWNHYVKDNNPPRIRILDDVAKLLLGSGNRKEGVGLSEFGILIVDSDGAIAKNDTLKNSHQGADRFSHDWNVSNVAISDILKEPEFRDYTKMQIPTSEVCRNCEFLEVCGGGMPLYRWKSGDNYDNPSVYCNDHKLVISHIADQLLQSNPYSVS